MKRISCSILFAIFIVAPAAAEEALAAGAVDAEAKKLIDAFFAANSLLKDTIYLLDKQERMRDGDVVKETLLVKLRVKPYAVYLARQKPKKGMEALYKQGGKMTGHTGSFPDITLNIDPQGSLAMKDQHHPIYSTGTQEIVRRLNQALKLADGDAPRTTIRKIADQKVDGVSATCIEVDWAKAGRRQIKAKDDETLYQLAKRTDSWPYLIYATNVGIDDLDDELDEGAPVFVPRGYAQKSIFCFDPTTALIVREIYHDKKGVWEKYDTRQRKVNPGLTAKDFDEDNKAYDF